MTLCDEFTFDILINRLDNVNSQESHTFIDIQTSELDSRYMKTNVSNSHILLKGLETS